ncbi:MAG: response regulator [Planctomycetota bacterium]
MTSGGGESDDDGRWTREEVELHLRRVVESAPLVLWAVDRNGIFTLSTGAALAGIGLLPGQVVGQSVFTLYADRPDIQAHVRRALRGEEFATEVTVDERTFETLHSPLRGSGGEVTGVLGVSIDITERRKAETERQRMQEQMLLVQKLESLGLLAGGIAHDFNNILTAILGGASTALMALPAEHAARTDLDHVVAAAKRAADLTRQLLAYSGRGHYEIRATDLSALVRDIAALLRASIQQQVKLQLELAPGLPAVEADQAQLQQVLMNLVINGAEAIGSRTGTVTVTTGVQTLATAAAMITPGGFEAGRYVFVEVHDTGGGMDAQTLNKIFDPFFSTKFTGRGLGLAAVLGIVRTQKGAIDVRSIVGQGTTFRVFFQASEATPAPPTVARTSFHGKGLVLVVDDDHPVRAVARRMLEHFGFTVVEAEDGRAGLERFGEHTAQIVLVLLDMTMPVMSGEETFRRLRTQAPSVPVILMSGYNEVEATRRFTVGGLAGFLQKPFAPPDLAQKLQAALGRRGDAERR